MSQQVQALQALRHQAEDLQHSLRLAQVTFPGEGWTLTQAAAGARSAERALAAALVGEPSEGGAGGAAGGDAGGDAGSTSGEGPFRRGQGRRRRGLAATREADVDAMQFALEDSEDDNVSVSTGDSSEDGWENADHPIWYPEAMLLADSTDGNAAMMAQAVLANMVVQAVAVLGPEGVDTACAVCQEPWVLGDLRVTTPCAHQFHMRCLCRSMVHQPAGMQECPMCRASLRWAPSPGSGTDQSAPATSASSE